MRGDDVIFFCWLRQMRRAVLECLDTIAIGGDPRAGLTRDEIDDLFVNLNVIDQELARMCRGLDPDDAMRDP